MVVIGFKEFCLPKRAGNISGLGNMAPDGFFSEFCLPRKHSVSHFFRQLWLVLGVKLMEINSNGCFPGRFLWEIWFLMV